VKRYFLAALLTLTAFLAIHHSLAAAPSVQEAEAPAGGQWNFADEEEATPTFTDDLKAQARELILLGAFCTLALVGFFRKSEWLKWITMAASVIYLGFMRSQLISVVNIFALTRWNLPAFRQNLEWYLFAIFTLVTTILWGRLYCGRICAFGSMTQLMDKIVPARLRFEVPTWLEQRANYIKYALLAGVVGYYVVTSNHLIFRYVEPFWMFGELPTHLNEFFLGLPSPGFSWGLWIGLAVLLVATVFVRNLYCRFLCPVGAFLGLLSNLTVFRIKRWKECNTCKICEKTCEWGAIRGPKIVASECVRCDDCERLYNDQEKCPHWLILLKKKARAV
jgi:polyferredoxin